MYERYLERLRLASYVEEVDFIQRQKRTCYNGIYPFKIFPQKELEEIEFGPITIFYGKHWSMTV